MMGRAIAAQYRDVLHSASTLATAAEEADAALTEQRQLLLQTQAAAGSAWRRARAAQKSDPAGPRGKLARQAQHIAKTLDGAVAETEQTVAYHERLLRSQRSDAQVAWQMAQAAKSVLTVHRVATMLQARIRGARDRVFARRMQVAIKANSAATAIQCVVRGVAERTRVVRVRQEKSERNMLHNRLQSQRESQAATAIASAVRRRQAHAAVQKHREAVLAMAEASRKVLSDSATARTRAAIVDWDGKRTRQQELLESRMVAAAAWRRALFASKQARDAGATAKQRTAAALALQHAEAAEATLAKMEAQELRALD